MAPPSRKRAKEVDMLRIAQVVLTVGLGILAAAAARADITVAMVGPITGQYAAFGAQFKAGAEMAIEDINAAGGLLGEKLKLEIGDDACDPKQAVAVANQLARKQIKFVAGHFCSGSSIPASKVYAEEGMIQISPASTTRSTRTSARPGILRVRPRRSAGRVHRQVHGRQLQEQEHRRGARQVGLRQGAGRRHDEVHARRRQEGKAVRGHHAG
jgi:hypothetical protein